MRSFGSDLGEIEAGFVGSIGRNLCSNLTDREILVRLQMVMIRREFDCDRHVVALRVS